MFVIVLDGMPCKKCKNGDKSNPADSGPILNNVDMQGKDVTGVSRSPIYPEINKSNEGELFTDCSFEFKTSTKYSMGLLRFRQYMLDKVKFY